MQIMATLHGHFANMLALDGDDIAGERDAAAVLGTAPFVAKKALEQSRRLGGAKIGEAITLIAAADLDVRGMSGLDPELVVEILVARLARQTRPARAAGGGRPGRRPAASAGASATVRAGVENHQRWFSRSRAPNSREPVVLVRRLDVRCGRRPPLTVRSGRRRRAR